ncbi:MAG: outer membrane protein assembly factor BamD [Lutibacter sp.]
MQKIKNFLLILIFTPVIFSCSEYQKVLNKGTVQEKYKMATKMYEAQKYSKAIMLFEKITPSFRGKPQMERIQFMVAQSHYNTKQYSLAAYYFDKFVKNYPKSSKVEESAFLSAYSYYKASPRYSLDQKDTNEALNAMQNYIFKYPNSKRIPEANKVIKELTFKLEKKAFEIAKQYYKIQDYIAAVTAFDNFLGDYLGSSLKEEAMYYKFKSAYELAINSYITKKEERLKNAVKAEKRLKKNFPESKYIAETDKMLITLNDELEKIKTQKNTVTNGL